MLGALVRDARRRGAALLNAELEWSWPECAADEWADNTLIVTSCRSRLAASRLQASIRRRQVDAHARRPLGTFHFVPEQDPDADWEVVG